MIERQTTVYLVASKPTAAPPPAPPRLVRDIVISPLALFGYLALFAFISFFIGLDWGVRRGRELGPAPAISDHGSSGPNLPASFPTR